MVTVGLLGVAGLAGQSWVAEQRPMALATCDPERTITVVVAADPTIAPALTAATSDLSRTPLDVGGCVAVLVQAKDPLQTAAELGTLPAAALPDVWVPDSTTWLDRIAPATDVALSNLGSLASSPLIVAVDPRSATDLGWSATPPTWREVLTSGRPVALPDLAGSAAGLSSLSALRETVRTAAGTTEATSDLRAVLTTVANAIDAGQVTTVTEAFERVEAGGPNSPIVPTSEQQWFLRTRDQLTPASVPIRPRDGTVLLDYPLVRVDRSAAGPSREAVEGVIRILEDAGREEARNLGFNPAAGQPTVDPAVVGNGAMIAPQAPEAVPEAVAEAAPTSAPTIALGPVLPPPSAEEVDGLLADLADLSRPARVLLVIDASVSMRAIAGGGTRATLARDATKTSLALFSDTATVSLWFFAIGMGGPGQDYTEIVAPRQIAADAGGVPQRAALLAGADTLTQRLTPGGTGLNDTVLAAFRAAQAGYDPEATNSVVVLTDGRNEDPNGISTDALLASLSAEADPQRPIRVAMVGLGGSTDAADLTRIAEATGGRAYVAELPEDFQSVLFDALRRRS